jgi:SOS-response transcriptional repressor LexA
MHGYKPTFTDKNPVRGHKASGRIIEWADGEMRHDFDEFNGVDLHRALTKNSPNYSLMKVVGNYMRPNGLLPNGWVIVDKIRKPKLGEVVAVRIDGCTIIRTIRKRGGAYYLVADDPSEPPYQINEGDEVKIVGVVTVAINFINGHLKNSESSSY